MTKLFESVKFYAHEVDPILEDVSDQLELAFKEENERLQQIRNLQINRIEKRISRHLVSVLEAASCGFILVPIGQGSKN